MELINGKVSDTAKVLIARMKTVIDNNNSVLKNYPSRYDLRSENHDLKMWIDQMEYHLYHRDTSRGYKKRDLLCLRAIIDRFGYKYLPLVS